MTSVVTPIFFGSRHIFIILAGSRRTPGLTAKVDELGARLGVKHLMRAPLDGTNLAQWTWWDGVKWGDVTTVADFEESIPVVIAAVRLAG